MRLRRLRHAQQAGFDLNLISPSVPKSRSLAGLPHFTAPVSMIMIRSRPYQVVNISQRKDGGNTVTSREG